MSGTTNQAAKLAASINVLAGMLSDRFWNEPEYDGVKDRFQLLGMIDAIHSAARELEGIVLDQSFALEEKMVVE